VAGDTERWVVAIGGNALADPHDPRDLARQAEHAEPLAAAFAGLLAEGKRLVLVHGNGPQVGARLLQNEAATATVPPSPLHICVAETQGQTGHVLSLALARALRARGIALPVACVVTHVIVERETPQDATKPVGLVYAEEEAHRLAAERGWQVARVPGGWRRVVPSPRPATVLEQPAIDALLAAGACVVAGGGGGIPLIEDAGGLSAVEAVVDKDYTAQRIATAIGARCLVFLTDVEGVALSFGGAQQQFLSAMTIADAHEHATRGEFAPGSMEPKVEAAIDFLEAGGEEARIASVSVAASALAGRGGTEITR